MVPINQVILGGDPLLGSSMVGNSLDEQLQLIEKYKQNLEAAKQLRQQVQPVQQPAQHRMIWDDIDAEINPMSDEQKSRLLQDEDYVDTYISSQLESMSKSSPVIGFMKPLITRALDKNFSKITKALELIADKDGNVDVEGILTEMMENLMTTNPFSFKTPFIGDIETGGGQIKFNLPLTNKRLVLNMSDLEAFKETLITKN